MAEDESFFWADSFAEKIVSREKFHFIDKTVPVRDKWVVKSSSSLSGVLHIGRLSDIIRSEAVFLALRERGFPVEFIYVTEDMDPLRKLPDGMPKSFEEFIGFPVSDVPDPDKCHKSYAEHHLEIFLKTMGDFVLSSPKIFSMRQEYKNGSFTESILELSKNAEKVKQIISEKQGSQLGIDWFPWKPICDKCGNLQTTVVKSIDGGKVCYSCRDYAFESFTAKGCGFEGESDLSKANGKLVWKSEWAAQWKRWNVCGEGAGKEYESSNSAFWVNAEICEKILNFPMPQPVFYEHLMVDGKKMSASVGNIVFPWQWIEVARAEALKFFYMKKIMKARSFSWSEIPLVELELDKAAKAVEGIGKLPDEKELNQLLKLHKFSHVKNRGIPFIPIDYSFAVFLVQLFSENSQIVSKLLESKVLTEKELAACGMQLLERFDKARKFVEKYASENQKISFLENLSIETTKSFSAELKKAFSEIAVEVEKIDFAEEIQQIVFNTVKKHNVNSGEAFKAIYSILLGKTQGPKIGLLIMALGKEKCIQRFKEAAE